MAQPSTPLPASTVVVARPTENQKFEIFMNRRPDKMDAYGGVYVFPGGRVEPADSSTAMLERTRGLSQLEAQKILGSEAAPDVCLGYWVAAARELFEESELCLFSDCHDDSGIDRDKRHRLIKQRVALQRGELDFPSLLAQEDLVCDVSRMTYFFHRITPNHQPMRFDTRFYLTALPSGQEPVEQSEEVVESLWISPGNALAKGESKEFPMMPPTMIVLRMLAEIGTWGALVSTYNLKQC